jgi:hypothetical protein
VGVWVAGRGKVRVVWVVLGESGGDSQDSGAKTLIRGTRQDGSRSGTGLQQKGTCNPWRHESPSSCSLTQPRQRWESESGTRRCRYPTPPTRSAASSHARNLNPSLLSIARAVALSALQRPWSANFATQSPALYLLLARLPADGKCCLSASIALVHGRGSFPWQHSSPTKR